MPCLYFLTLRTVSATSRRRKSKKSYLNFKLEITMKIYYCLSFSENYQINLSAIIDDRNSRGQLNSNFKKVNFFLFTPEYVVCEIHSY